MDQGSRAHWDFDSTARRPKRRAPVESDDEVGGQFPAMNHQDTLPSGRGSNTNNSTPSVLVQPMEDIIMEDVDTSIVNIVDTGSPTTITSLVADCHSLFQEILENIRPQADEFDIVETQFGRLNIWASNIGALATGNSSLDHRLRLKDDIKSMVIQLLDVLSESLRQVIDKGGDPTHWTRIFEEAIDGVSASLDRLQTLAIAIRKSSTQSRNIRSKAFSGGDNESNFRDFVLTILKHRFKEANGSLCEQLAESIALRRKQFSYRIQHQEKLARSTTQLDSLSSQAEHPIVAGTKHRLPMQPIENLGIDKRESKRLRFASPVFSSARYFVAPSQTNASTLDTKVFRKILLEPKAPRSIVSQGTFVQDSKLEYPPPPATATEQRECTCPYCCEILTSTLARQEEWWRHHVDKDLEPYSCISEKCRSLPVQFFKFHDWLEHMETHGPSNTAWNVHLQMFQCPLCQSLEPFRWKEEFIAHMGSCHAGRFTQAQLLTLSRRSTVTILRDPYICPLCNCMPEEIEKVTPRNRDKIKELLPRHIAGHLKSLAFMALPYRDDINDEESEASRDRPAGEDYAHSRRASDISDMEIDEETRLTFQSSLFSNEFGISYLVDHTELGRPQIRGLSPNWDFLPPKPYDSQKDKVIQSLIVTSRRVPFRDQTHFLNPGWVCHVCGVYYDSGTPYCGSDGLSCFGHIPCPLCERLTNRYIHDQDQIRPRGYFDLPLGGSDSRGSKVGDNRSASNDYHTGTGMKEGERQSEQFSPLLTQRRSEPNPFEVSFGEAISQPNTMANKPNILTTNNMGVFDYCCKYCMTAFPDRGARRKHESECTLPRAGEPLLEMEIDTAPLDLESGLEAELEGAFPMNSFRDPGSRSRFDSPFYYPGTIGHGGSNQGQSSKLLEEQQESLKKLLEEQESLKKLLEEQESLKKLLEDQKSLRRLLENKEFLKKLLEDQESLKKLLKEQKSLKKLLGDQGYLKKLVEDQESLTKLVEEQESLRKLLGEQQESMRKILEEQGYLRKLYGESIQRNTPPGLIASPDDSHRARDPLSQELHLPDMDQNHLRALNRAYINPIKTASQKEPKSDQSSTGLAWQKGEEEDTESIINGFETPITTDSPSFSHVSLGDEIPAEWPTLSPTEDAKSSSSTNTGTLTPIASRELRSPPFNTPSRQFFTGSNESRTLPPTTPGPRATYVPYSPDLLPLAVENEIEDAEPYPHGQPPGYIDPDELYALSDQEMHSLEPENGMGEVESTVSNSPGYRFVPTMSWGDEDNRRFLEYSRREKARRALARQAEVLATHDNDRVATRPRRDVD
ncbi:hypothetical protein TWF730_008825 [Orbilia blumenaviensis]|uniref:C2H2-type domain-containing protein n=1 Tax=Orbilia blumenaviensis TaxID=1796055 RepID=A0AAV9V4A7_9PEZI